MEDEEVLDRMTIDDYIKILKLWLYKGTTGLTNTKLGYMEGWFIKTDKEAFETAIEIMRKYQMIKEITDNWVSLSDETIALNFNDVHKIKEIIDADKVESEDKG